MNPILVTGSPRSGSTWVGQMLSISKQVAYIHEPFNPDNYRRGRCDIKFTHRFQYVCKENGVGYEQPLRDLLNYRYKWGSEVPHIRSVKDVGRTLRDSIIYKSHNMRKARPLVKDPIAICSAEWLAQTFNMHVIVMIRHPAAFSSSLKRKNQIFKFSELLDQPLLMRDYLEPFREEMEAMRNGGQDRIEEAILLWRIIYSIVLRYQEQNPKWIFLSHEELSKDPINGFGDLYSKLNIEFTRSVEATISKHTVSARKQRIVGGNSITMDSAANIKSWSKKLTESEMFRIRQGTADVYPHFYSNEDWNYE